MQFIAIVAVAWGTTLAFVGWGRALEAALWRGRESGDSLPVGVAACLGLALSLVAAGPLVAIDAFSVLLAAAWLLAGVAISIYFAYPRLRAARPTLATALPLLVLGGATLYLVVQAARLAPVNFCDNEGAYLPLIHRLAETGGLIEPFSQRRLGTSGGMLAFQAVFEGLLGAKAAYVPDVVVGGLLIVLLFVGGARGLPRLAVGALLAGSFLLWSSGRNNLSPTYAPAAMIAAGVLLAAHVRVRFGALDQRSLAAIALLAAGLLSVRVNHATPMLLFGLVLALLSTRDLRSRLGRAALFTGIAFGATVPWMIALWRSSGTPLFPPFGGNLDESWPSFRDQTVGSLGDYAEELADLGGTGEVAILILGTGAAVAALFALRGRVANAAPHAGVMAVAALVTAATAALSLSTFLPVDLARLTWPVLAGAAVAALGLLRDAAADAHGRQQLAGFVVLAVVALVLAGPPSQAVDTLRDSAAAVRDIPSEGGLGLREPWERSTGEYRAAQQSIPAGARIASAADFPQLFDLERNDAVNLDIVGNVAPGGGLPFFEGAVAKADYLRDRGFDFIVATDPAVSACLWSTRTWRTAAEKPYALWAPYFLDWFASVAALERSRPDATRRHGALIVHDLRGG